MTDSDAERRARRPTPRGRRPLLWLAGLAAAAILFGAGVAVGEAIHDNPAPGITQTSVRTIHP